MDKKRILVVDDEPHQRIVFRNLLKQGGYGVFEAERGQKALEIIEQQDIDLVLLDVVMPVMDGIQCLEKIKEKHKDLPVVLMSGSEIKQKVKKELEDKAVDFFSKPIMKKKLLYLIEKAIKEESD